MALNDQLLCGILVIPMLRAAMRSEKMKEVWD